MFKHIIHEELDLRLLEPRHAEMVFAEIVRNREHLAKWLPWAASTRSAEDTRMYIQSELQRFANNNGFSAGIFYKDQYAGNISLHDIHWNVKMTSIGYWLSAEHQGKGIMTACCKAILYHGFGVLGLNRIEIRARSDNNRSIAIPTRLGFKKEGTLRQVDINKNEYYDHVVYGMLRNEWQKSRLSLP